MIETLRDKLKTLPNEPGVYFHRDAEKKIIYIGKAAVLKNRVMSYFQTSKNRDPRTQLLVAEIADTEWITVGSEVEALFLESEFIKRYKPKYNIDLKDDKNFIYIKISGDEFPVFTYARRPMDDKAHYYGPFTSSDAVRRAMRMLRKVFPYVTHAPWPKRGCLQYHLGLCPGPEEGAITAVEYRKNVRRLEMYLKGEQTKLMADLEKEMLRAAKKNEFEIAARARDQLQDLRSFGKQMVFGDREAFDLSRDQALVGLAERLELPEPPRRIECYDISHLQGTDNVASMVVFTDGVANRDEYRRFQMRTGGNDDFEHMREVMRRRFSPKNLAAWPKPDLLVIDGGKGQVGAVLGVLDGLGISIPTVGMAKREDELIRRQAGRASKGHWDSEAWVTSSADWNIILLPPSSHVLQLLQRIRDEAHRFAITYQSILRGKRQVKSQLDDIPGVGPATRKVLIKTFGSVRGLKLASIEEITAAIGSAKAHVVQEYLAKD
jgi:excinuclease ABC subunit C